MQAVGVRTSAILATHTFGTPCEIDELETVARQTGTRLFFDAAHAFGSRRAGVPIGRFGDAEVFSLSPTKVLVGGEGGIVATNDDLLAERCRIGRDYGNPGDYDCQFVGLNARMSEFHAAFAIASLTTLDERIARRNELVDRYREALTMPGLAFPIVHPYDLSTFKDFTVLVDPEVFGIDALGVAGALEAVGVETRRYYSPPVHSMRAYRRGAQTADLPVTERISSRVLTLPLWSHMSGTQVDYVSTAVRRIHEYVDARRSA
jgi:dTDP-4-amino-4,6-dideoxygalactose transaminase